MNSPDSPLVLPATPAAADAIPVETLLALYRMMCRIRAFEDAAETASQGGVAAFGQAPGRQVAVRGPLHLSTGQGPVAAGVCAHLKATDFMTATHRGHGHTLAKRAELECIRHRPYANATRLCVGRC